MENDQNKKKKDNEHDIPEEEEITTYHQVTVKGESIKYKATTGTMLLKKEVDEKSPKAIASIFYIAYQRIDTDEENRPITFSFNGGPGSSSVWLHLGLLGPRRVIAEKDEKPVPPPYELVNNDYSLIDRTDLVFIDPVSTGWSRPVPGEKAEQFHNYQKDIEWVGEFIRLYTTRSKRWRSPKFLIGESYGTTRAAGLSGYLQDNYGMYLNGIMLISNVLNFQTIRFNVGNDMPPLLYLPSFTATAWYHNKLDEDLQDDLHETLQQVEEFVENEYLLGLMRGDLIEDEEKKNIVSKLSRYTGLSEEYIEQTNLRIEIMRFIKELRRDERITVGRLDSRFTNVDRDAAGEFPEFDPSMVAIQGPYTATFYDYITSELKFEKDLPYNILANLYETWKYENAQNKYLNVAETLRQAMSKNQALKVFIANGYYDLATPYYATEYTFNHLELDKSLRDNISMEYYEAGHMMYMKEESLAKLRKDLDQFITNSV